MEQVPMSGLDRAPNKYYFDHFKDFHIFFLIEA